MTHAAIFLDKDGTLIKDVPYNVDPDKIYLVEQAGQALRLFMQLGFRLFVVTNQAGIAKGIFSEEALLPMHARLLDLLAAQNVSLDGFYYCPHHPEGSVRLYAVDCTCRKPQPGLLLRAAHDHGIALSRSWMIGDILHDVEAGKRAGCRTVLIDNGNETEWEVSAERTPDLIVSNLYDAAVGISSTI